MQAKSKTYGMRSTPVYVISLGSVNVADHIAAIGTKASEGGLPIQYIRYTPYGELIANQQMIGYDKRYKFTGKERDAETGYDYFGARFYDHCKGFWYSVDPLTDKYPGNTPYLYCGGNPIMLVDPDGRSTKVIKNDDDSYTVFGGELNDKDLHIYEYTKDKDGNYIKGNAIGVTTSLTSFYNLDTKQWGGTINPQDESGQIFLGDIFLNKISLAEYKQNAHGQELYDFKYSNGTVDKSDDQINIYRSMPIGRNQNGEYVYSRY